MTGTESVGQAPVPTVPPKVGFHEGVTYRGGNPQSMKTYYRRENEARVASKLRGEREFYDWNIERSISEANVDGRLSLFTEGRVKLQRRIDRNPTVKRVRKRVAARKEKSV
jgi:hypothetical protein